MSVYEGASRQQLAQGAVAPGVNIEVTGVREDDGKTIARVVPTRPVQVQQLGGTPAASPQQAG